MVNRLPPRDVLTEKEPGYFPFDRPSSQSPETRMLGFDTCAWFSFQGANPAIQIPPAMVIYRVPANVNRTEVRGLGIEAEPIGPWLNNVSWAVRVSGAGAQEDFFSSSISGAVATVANNGLRWAPMGSIARPVPVRYLLMQEQSLQLFITSYRQGANLQRFTVLARASGVSYL